MTDIPLWDDDKEREWLRSLKLPSLPWVQPFLPRLGLPQAIVEHPEVLIPLHAQAVAEFKALYRANAGLGYVPGLEAHIAREVMTGVLRRLAQEVGEQTAIDFERWARRHVVCNEIDIGLRDWWGVLLDAYRALIEDRQYYQEHPEKAPPAPPKALVPLLPLAAGFADLVQGKQLDAEIRHHAPPPTEEDAEGLDMSLDAMIIESIINNEQTIAVLRALAAHLNAEERAEVVAWATSQINQDEDLIPAAWRQDQIPSALEECLQAEPPCSDVPPAIYSGRGASIV
ncbi:hypothetical protein [Anthocerotibacter panamensis]|uniref:hypothetical protein n=1 Tax=Anthocerotibacter panamensis TaxID=2857077 RepID=UPI001C4072A9|nr:hypothetical protein [Anthocerotibacter panamensis]